MKLNWDKGTLKGVRSFFAVSLLFISLTGASLYSMYKTETSAILASLNLTESLHNELTSRSISMNLRDLFVDVQVTAEHIEIKTFIFNRTTQSRRNVEREFITLCRYSQKYDQIRILDLNGMEQVRVNYNDGAPAAVPVEKLQDKKHRYYFQEALKLAPGEIYISPFDLNIENHQIEKPLRPMIRVSTPILDYEGNRIGILILNYLGQKILDDIKHDEKHSSHHVMLLNQDGYWLLSPDKEKEWAFMYEDRKSVSFATEHSKAWQHVSVRDSGQFFTPEGSYTYSTIFVSPQSEDDKISHRFWKIVCFMPISTINARIHPIQKNYLQIFTGVLIIILFGAFTRARFIRAQALGKERLERSHLEAENANRAKSDFLARMSHEIRTPMNAIIGLTHLTGMTQLSPNQKDYLDKITLSAQTLLGIINDILDFSKIEADYMEIENTDFVLDDVLNNTVNMLGLQAEQKGLEFLLMVRSEVPDFLIGDPLRLGQILLNLTGNAIKFTDSGDVVLSAELAEESEDEARIRFTIRDTGIGISKEQMETLFEPFSQADGSISRRFGGTGLGLTISKRLVEMMNGVLEVESQLNKGSTFTCTIPFKLQPGSRDSVPDCPLNLKGMRVLVADDSNMSRQVLKSVLKSFSLDVTTAEDGKQALQMILDNDTTSPFKLVVTDWRMPDLDGLELTREIRRSHIANQPKIIMLTAYGHDEVHYRAQQAGLDGFMLKPFNRSLLFDTIMEALSEGKYRPQRKNSSSKRFGIPSNILGATVLVTDDNEINRQVVTEILENAGVIVNTAVNGKEALDMLATCSCDAVLMDIQMPILDGFQTVKAIRENPELKDLPVIAMTAHALHGDREKSLLAGMNDHVTKPIEPRLLIKVLSEWLPKKRSRVCVGSLLRESERNAPDPDFPQLSGINVEMALDRLQGNRRLYEKLLTDFARECKNSKPRIALGRKSGDLKTTAAAAHYLVGIAGNIGAEELHEILNRVEAQCNKGDPLSDSLVEEFEAEADRVIQGILSAFPSTPIPVPIEHDIPPEKIDALCSRLEAIEKLLDMHDIEARTLFTELKPELDEVAPGFTAQLEMTLNRFDFSGGQRLVASLLDACRKDEKNNG